MRVTITSITGYGGPWAAAAILLAIAGCGGTITTVSGEIVAGDATEVVVTSSVGSVEVVGAECLDRVVAEAELQFPAAGPRSALARTELVILDLRREGDLVLVDLDVPASAQPVWPHLVVGIPEGLAADVETRAGAVRVEDVSGDVAVDTSDGAVEVVGGCGATTARSTNGALSVSSRAGAVELASTNGALELRDVDGDAVGQTTNGAIRVEGHRGDLDLATSNGAVSIETELLDGGSCRAFTTNGDVSLSIPIWTSAELDAATTGGAVTLDGLGADGSVGGSRARVLLGSGDGEIVLRTTNGSVGIVGRCEGGDGWRDAAASCDAAAE